MDSIRNINLLFSAAVLCSLRLSGQFYHLPGAYHFSIPQQQSLAAASVSLHPGLQPAVHFFSDKYQHKADTQRIYRYQGRAPLRDALFSKHLIRASSTSENFSLAVDPLLNLESGRDLADTSGGSLYTNTRGFIGSGRIGERFYFETLLAENQSLFPGYIAEQAAATLVVPGQGRWKTFKTTGYDYAFSSGFISVQLRSNINLQVGHGKHKVGHGYRSLLLSDNAFNYAYVRVSQHWFGGRLQYTNIYASLMNLIPAAKTITPFTERLFQKKSASFQYLSWNLHPRFNIGLFQGMIWEAGDNRNRQHLGWQYFNPVIFTNLAGFGLSNRNNILAGADMLLKVTDKISLYTQVMADGDNAAGIGQGTGYQAGIKIFDVLRIRNLFFQAEYNQTERGTYSSPVADGDQSYTHYNQTLGFTPGNGSELVLLADYKYKRFLSHIRYHYQQPAVTANVYTYNNIINAAAGYVLNPAYQLNLSCGITYRTQKISTFSPLDHTTRYIYLSLRTSVYNLYYDF